MKHTRIIVTYYGGSGALQVIEEECPEPKAGQVRVRVLAAGVSLPDIMAREGIHPETPLTPFTPGWDLVGLVDCLGEGAAGFEPGQIVAAMPIHGTYAEFVCVCRNMNRSQCRLGWTLPRLSALCLTTSPRQRFPAWALRRLITGIRTS
jgi:NADPH2:quinone reductase